MLIFCITVVIMLGFLDRAIRVGRVELLRMAAQNDISGLRDTLQDAAINGAVCPRDTLYQICSRLLDSTPEELSERRFYSIALRAFRDRVNPYYARIEKALKKPENSRYRSILDGFSSTMQTLHGKQHLIVYPLTIAVFQLRSVKPDVRLTTQEVKEALRNPRVSHSDIAQQPC